MVVEGGRYRRQAQPAGRPAHRQVGREEHVGIAVEQRGGPFLETAWVALRAVPAGSTVSYTGLAAAAGRPEAVRAAASACARNAAALFVPCHRVVRTDGTLGGYRWGLDVKRSLIAHESETGS